MATSSSTAPGTTATCTGSTWHRLLYCDNNQNSVSNEETANGLFAALVYSFALFGAQFLAWTLLRLRLSRIYRPRSYLVPEKERVPPPPPGLVAWLIPLFTTPNLAIIQKCGLDAYFFLRYLRMLLKLFLPVAIVVLPILLPINRYSGDQTDQQTGLAILSVSNVAVQYKSSRLWAHLVLAICVILWIGYVVYAELRVYIRVRQAYLTSPQHRIRASATTVLVTGIPAKWRTLEALSGLYDVFPGGIKNIWINRNFDDLGTKVSYRDDIARSLEDAELGLIKRCLAKYSDEKNAEAKKMRKSKGERQQDKADEDAAAEQMAQGAGVSAGDQHQVAQGMQDVLHDAEELEEREPTHPKESNPLAFMNQGLGLVGHGLGQLGKGVGAFGHKVVGGVDEGFSKAGQGLNKAGGDFNRVANTGMGFATDDELFRTPTLNDDSPTAHSNSAVAESSPVFGASVKPHPMAVPDVVPGKAVNDTPNSDRYAKTVDVRTTGPSMESKPRSPMEIELPEEHRAKRKPWEIWKNHDNSLAIPSPQPHTADEDEFPLNVSSVRTRKEKQSEDAPKTKWTEKLAFWKSNKEDDDEGVYPSAVRTEWDEDQDGEPRWKHYIEPKERETMRVPLICPTWFPSIPLVGRKVDRIYYLRRELARLNLEIETDQNNVEKFPHMNSAFIQFNHQVAAHMACQSLSHHVPQQMAPRLVEISPDDVLWENMSITWWERYIRSGVVLLTIVAMIIFYAVPVSFTSLLSNISDLAAQIPWLGWLNNAPTVVISIIKGVLPPVLLAIILALVPILIRLLVGQQGVPTGNARELGVQTWYFFFLNVQVFFVVTISSGIFAFFGNAAEDPGSVVTDLATNLPKASNYFLNYLTVQALSNGSGALVQVLALLKWFVLGPLLDSTPRAKWKRQTNLPNIKWGSFFPVFTNFAAIGIVYSVISPLILPFMLGIFGLFWIVYRYNVLYVYQFRNDTGGLLFPTAVNQLFTGVYFLEIALIGLFFISRNPAGDLACLPHAIIMIVALVLTIVYQVQLNKTFDPLFRYLPITLEDEAVIRDEVFAKEQASRFAPLNTTEEDDRDNGSLQDQLEEREMGEDDANNAAEDLERSKAEERRHGSNLSPKPLSATQSPDHHSPTSPSGRGTWKTDRWRDAVPHTVSRVRHMADSKLHANPAKTEKAQQDVEAQHTVGDILFSGFADELEDLSPQERDLLVRYSFQHSALRAKRPVVWIPRDRLGVSDDEIKRAEKMSTVTLEGEKKEKTFIWMSNAGTALDAKRRAVFRRSPPDFSNVDLIAL